MHEYQPSMCQSWVTVCMYVHVCIYKIDTHLPTRNPGKGFSSSKSSGTTSKLLLTASPAPLPARCDPGKETPWGCPDPGVGWLKCNGFDQSLRTCPQIDEMLACMYARACQHICIYIQDVYIYFELKNITGTYSAGT